MLNKIYNSKSNIFLSLCISFLLGITFASLVSVTIDVVYMYTSCLVLVAIGVICWNSRTRWFLFLCSIFFWIGFVRYQVAYPFGQDHISNFSNRTVETTGYVSAEPDVRTDGVRYIVTLTGDIQGDIYLKQTRYPRYSYGDTLQLKCKIQMPEPIEDFRYDMYLARFGVFAICQNPFVKRIEQGSGSILFRTIFHAKEVVATQVNLLWHEPYASFMAGLLYGYRGGLGELNELFSRTGTTHIIAISGYNITIVSTILMSICIRLYIPRKKAFLIIVCGICVFVIFAGLSASVVRAGIMGCLVLLATQMGSRSRILNVMILTAAIMTLHNPFVLIWDAGFQLSFLSTLGLVYLSPHIEPWFTKVPAALGLRESLVATLSATLSTLPLILSQFGRLSIVALPVNMLILWIIPFLMALGFFAVVISWFFFPLGQVLAWVAWVGLEYIVIVVRWFASLPFAAVDLTIPAWMSLSIYVLVPIGLWKIKKDTRVS